MCILERHNPALEELQCQNNALGALDVTHNPALTTLTCTGNALTALDVTHNPALTMVNCNNNALTSLDVSQNQALLYLHCTDNALTVLDVTHNPDLMVLNCNNNQLTSLDLSQNGSLGTLGYAGNVRGVALDADNGFDISTLPSLESSSLSGLTGGSLDGTRLTFQQTEVSYSYATGYTGTKDFGTLSFTLKAAAATPEFSITGGAVDYGTVVTLSCTTGDAAIYYTVDGSEPTAESPLYEAGIVIDRAMTVKAIALKDGLEPSSVAEAAFSPIVATPAFSMDGGAVDYGTVVTLSCTTEGAAVYYTVDGGEPTAESPLYEAGIVIDRAMTVKAIALKEGWEASSVAEASFSPIVATPAFSMDGGAVDYGTVITLSCTTEGAAVYYTVDGSEPTAESTPYADGIVIDKAMTVKAIALKEGWEASSVAEASFTLKALPVVATPAFSIAGGAVDSGTVITLSCTTEGAAVYYTVDGSEPTAESTPYADGIVIDRAMTVKAIALKDGWEASSVAEASFTLNTKPGDPSDPLTPPTANESALTAAPIAYVQG
ncbi:MAG: chitobiase/beta-hexosaminidase C-terminal domain-containing protein, partial [Bacteroidales bacterium]|nr:chitobiase/beta-hexosaminidase C-terminal domain-containing protein [Bacteroidales bacterium]